MEIKKAQENIDEIIQKYGGYWEPLSMLARLVEEVGELSREINIRYGGKKRKFKEESQEIEKELADIMFTVIAISNGLEIDLEKNLNEKFELIAACPDEPTKKVIMDYKKKHPSIVKYVKQDDGDKNQLMNKIIFSCLSLLL